MQKVVSMQSPIRTGDAATATDADVIGAVNTAATITPIYK